MLPKKLQKKLDLRKNQGSLRVLSQSENLIDFASNDYLGFASSQELQHDTLSLLKLYNISKQGATGSRLLSGNHKLYTVAEQRVSHFHKSEGALIFNSGYDANIGFFQAIPQRGDLIIYDEYIHASIRDGVQMSLARGYKFKHNDVTDLEDVMLRLRGMAHLNDRPEEHHIYVVTESVFSMDGDSPDLISIVALCQKYNAHLIVDEAHAIGVLGVKGEGLVQSLSLENKIFARIVTFGKALGSHGAAILGSAALTQYLYNYARSFIYTTGLPPHSVSSIITGYNHLKKGSKDSNSHPAVHQLKMRISYFKEQFKILNLSKTFLESHSAIHCAIISSNDRVKVAASTLQKNGYDVRPILSPTVPKGEERLRICLHAYNTKEEIAGLLTTISEWVAP